MNNRKMEDIDFKEYERIVETVINQNILGIEGLEVQVERDVKIKGKSGHKHQIDVAFRVKVHGIKLFFIVECKNYKRKVGVGDLLTFKSRIDDIGANKGIFVSTKGFQPGALQIAKSNSISLVIINSLEWWDVVNLFEYQGKEKAKNFLLDLLYKLKVSFGLNIDEIENGIIKEQLNQASSKNNEEFEYLAYLKNENLTIIFNENEYSLGSNVRICAYHTIDEIENQKGSSYLGIRMNLAMTINDRLNIKAENLFKYLICEYLN